MNKEITDHGRIRTPLEWAASGNWQTLAENPRSRVDFVKRIQLEVIQGCIRDAKERLPLRVSTGELVASLERMEKEMSK